MGSRNAELNALEAHPIRWIVDDVNKFLLRERRRGRRYDAILLDPPSFGRGKSGELYKIEQAMLETLENVRSVLSPNPGFVYLTSHTPGFTPTVLKNLLKQHLPTVLSTGARCDSRVQRIASPFPVELGLVGNARP